MAAAQRGELAGVVAAVAAIVRAGVRSGEFKPVDPLLVHAGIVAPLLLFFASAPLRARLERAGIARAAGFQRDEIVSHIQRVALQMLRGAGAPAEAGVADPRARSRR